MDEFLALPGDTNKQRQDRFDQKVVGIILRHFEVRAGLTAGVERELGDQLGLSWLMNTYEDFPVRLIAYKAKRLSVPQLMQKPLTTAIYRQFQEAEANYPGEPLGVVFAAEGDGLPEMVMHNCCHYTSLENQWRLQLGVFDGTKENRVVVDPLKGFLEMISVYTQWKFEGV